MSRSLLIILVLALVIAAEMAWAVVVFGLRLLVPLAVVLVPYSILFWWVERWRRRKIS